MLNGAQELQKILRLLASCNIELGKYDEALSILSSNSADTSPETLFILFRLHLLKERYDESQSVATRIIAHTSLRVETGIALCTLYAEKEQNALATQCYKALLSHYSADPVSRSTVVLHWVEYILSSAEGGDDDPTVGAMLDEALGRSAGATPVMLTPTANEELRSSLWDTAVASFQKKNYRVSLEWFRRALPLFSGTGDDSLDRAKCLRMIAQCSLAVGELGSAVEYAGLALEIEPESLCGQVLMFRARLTRNDKGDEELAAGTLRDIVSNGGASSVKEKQEYLELCAQCAIELGKNGVAASALEAVITLRCSPSGTTIANSNNGNSNSSGMDVEEDELDSIDRSANGKDNGGNGNSTKDCRISWILRSYIKLMQDGRDSNNNTKDSSNNNGNESPSVYEKCCDVVTVCMEHLCRIGPVSFFGNFSEEHGGEEASWLFSACWNMGREAALAKEYSVASRLYDHSYALSKVLPAADPSASPETRRMCCILSAAAGLETGDQGFARRALVSVAAAKETLFPSLASGISSGRKTSDKCVPLLYLLEFQASVVLGYDKDTLTRIITDAGMSGALEFGMFESIADYCNDTQQDIACIALKQALSILLLPSSSSSSSSSSTSSSSSLSSSITAQQQQQQQQTKMSITSQVTSSSSVTSSMTSSNVLTKRESVFSHGVKVSRILRKLIECQSKAGKVGKRRDETFCHYETALRVLSAAAAGVNSGSSGSSGSMSCGNGMRDCVWPEDEVEWFMATCWNNGVFFYRATDFAKAEGWMSLSMGFGKYLKGKKSNKLMEKAYNEVLSKLRG